MLRSMSTGSCMAFTEAVVVQLSDEGVVHAPPLARGGELVDSQGAVRFDCMT